MACATPTSPRQATSAACTAIEQANVTVGLDTIHFNIPGTGVQTITPLSPLPYITDPVIIDGYTQPGAASATDSTPAILLIELNGSRNYSGAGLWITAGNSTVKGLVINRFYYGHGIGLSGGGGNVIRGNYIGTDVTGTTIPSNSGSGVVIINVPNNTIGGTIPEARNVISGNSNGVSIYNSGAKGNLVQGNYIGTDVTGTVDLGNGGRGVDIIAPNNTIGGTAAGARNLISGNNGSGVDISGSSATGNLVQGNYIGTDVTGTVALGNSQAGVGIIDAPNNTIGGTTPEARNVISGNDTSGVEISGSSAAGNLVQGNYIGTDVTGTAALGNSYQGVDISAPNNTIGGTGAGAANVIAFNVGAGVAVESGTGNRILSNSIFSNSGLGIDLYESPNYYVGVTANDPGDGDSGANNLQNYPVLSSVTPSGSDLVITGALNSAANATFRVEFFANTVCDPSEFGEGQTFFGATDVTTDGSGNASFTVTLPAPAGQFISATATDGSNNTSEFSQCKIVTLPAPVPTAPTLISPTNNALTNDNTRTFVWSAVRNATSYELQVATASTFANVVFAASGSATIQTTTALNDGRYYWRVRGSGLVGAPGPWSAARQFTVDTVPLTTAATVKNPANLSPVTTARPAFSWAALSGAGRYRLQADDDPGFGSPAVNVVVTGTGYTIPGTSPALPQGIYNWRVLAIDPAGNEGTNWSLAPQFTVNIQTAPASNAFSTDTTPTFTWKGVTGAIGYQLQLATDPAFSSPVSGYPRALGVVTTFTPTTPLGYGTYYWRVLVAGETPVDAVSRKLTITPPLPAAPSLITPLAGAQINDQTPEFTWNAVGGAAAYEIQVDNTNTFSTMLEFTAIGAPTAQTATTLNSGTCYWRVRAINSYNAPGSWSAVRSFTVDTIAPAAPTLTAPAEGGVVSTTRPVMTWGAVATATRYQVDVDDTSDFSSRIVVDAVVTTTSFKPPTALPQGMYFWRVQAMDAAGNVSGESTARTFTVFIGTAPRNGVFTTDTTPTFTWAAVTGATGYTLQVDDDTDFSADLVLNQSLGAVTSFTPTTPLGSGIYHWRVLVAGETPVSTVYRTLFLGLGAAPAAPTLVSPANAAMLNDNTPTFQWSAVTPPAGVTLTDYQLQIASNSTFTSGVLTFTSASPSFTAGSPLSEGVHYWHVRARFDSGSPGAWSAVRSFTVDTIALAAPTLTAPVDTAVITNTRTPTLTWSPVATAKRYLVEVSTDAGFTALVVNQAVVTTTSYTIPKAIVLADAQYYWRISAVDGAGNTGFSSPPRTFVIFVAG